MADLRIDIASEFVGAKAFKQADTATSALSKQVTRLAKSYLSVVGVQKLMRAQLNAAKAFAADDKAARVLSRSLNNLGLAYADPAVKTFIADLEKQFGVLDDQLRPAFQRLLTTTGDVAKSQSLLKTALDLAAASGVDVVTVAGDLSKGYVGQTRALAKYGLGLTQAQLKAMKFEEVQAKINSLFGGQAAVAVNSYSGKFDRLNVAIANASETLGKGFLEGLTAIGGGGTQGFENTLGFIEDLSQAAAKFQRNFGIGVGQFLAILRGDFAAVKALGESAGKSAPFMGAIPSIQTELNKKAAWDRINQYKKEAALQAKLLAAKKAELKAAKDAAALKKASNIFDIEQTQIVAALKGKITEDERKRLELQLALITGNTTEASKLAGELGKAQGLSAGLIADLKGLPDAKNPFAGWAAYLDAIEAQVKRIAMSGTGGGAAGGGAAGITGNVPSGMTPGTNIFTVPSTGLTAAQATLPQFNVRLVLDGKEIASSVSNYQTNDSLSGTQVAINRRSGSFATP